MREWFRQVWPWLVAPLFWMAVGLALFATCSCARVQYVPLETARTDSVYGVRVATDSVYVMDSVRVEVRTERDTVYRTEYRYRTHWRERVARDTLVSVRVDSVAVPVPVEVERELTWWEKTRLGTWKWLATAIVLCVGWAFRKPLATLARRLLTKTT